MSGNDNTVSILLELFYTYTECMHNEHVDDNCNVGAVAPDP